MNQMVYYDKVDYDSSLGHLKDTDDYNYVFTQSAKWSMNWKKN
jgi:hypothetical protein